MSPEQQREEREVVFLLKHNDVKDNEYKMQRKVLVLVSTREENTDEDETSANLLVTRQCTQTLSFMRCMSHQFMVTDDEWVSSPARGHSYQAECRFNTVKKHLYLTQAWCIDRRRWNVIMQMQSCRKGTSNLES